MEIHKHEYYRAQYITGPTAVPVSIKFGVTPENGIRVIKLLKASETDGVVKFNLNRHLNELKEGVGEANAEFGGNLQIEEVQIVPSDYPGEGHAKYVAYKIAKQRFVL